MNIKDITASLQHQIDVPLWGVANSDTIIAIANGTPVKRGPRGRLLQFLFYRTGTSFLGLQALRLIGLVVSVTWFRKARRVRRHCNNDSYQELFIGFGAGSEDELWNKFCLADDRSVVHLNQTNPASLGLVACPKLKSILKYIWDDSQKIVRGLKRSENKYLSLYRKDWMTFASRRLGYYAFYKAWFDALPSSVVRVVYISPDTPAFAALDSKRNSAETKIEFWQHGLLERSDILPHFHKACMLTYPEALHIKSLTSCENVVVDEYRNRKTPKYAKRILLISTYDWGEFKKVDHVALYAQFIDWAQQQGFEIVVRPHPCEDSNFWTIYFPSILVDSSRSSLQSCIEKWLPLFLVLRGSTSAIHALKQGVLSISLIQEMKENTFAMNNVVFPFEDIVFFWPRDISRIEILFKESEKYKEAVMQAMSILFGKGHDKVDQMYA